MKQSASTRGLDLIGFSAFLRLPEIDALHRDWASLNLPKEGIPRLTDPF